MKEGMDAGRRTAGGGHQPKMGGGAARKGSKETLRQALAVLQHVEELL